MRDNIINMKVIDYELGLRIGEKISTPLNIELDNNISQEITRFMLYDLMDVFDFNFTDNMHTQLCDVME